MSKVSAASGPYAAELRASNPKTAIPAAGPSLSPFSSDDRSALPNSRSISDITQPLLHPIRTQEKLQNFVHRPFLLPFPTASSEARDQGSSESLKRFIGKLKNSKPTYKFEALYDSGSQGIRP